MGGWDWLYQYMHYTVGVPAPSWVWLFTAPFGFIPYPLAWYTWIALSVIIIGLCAKVFGYKWWWLVPISAAAFHNYWLGQVEALVLLGVTLAWLVTLQKIRWQWMGLAIMLMMIKPQVGFLPSILFMCWLYDDRGWKRLGWSIWIAMAIFMVSMILYPTWGDDIWVTMKAYVAPPTNASIFPWGLLALPIMLFKMPRLIRLRIALAINLLCSPYFLLYHTTTLIAVANPLLILMSYVPPLMSMTSAAILPLLSIAHDLYTIRKY